MRSADEKLILREFLVYKIYNLFTPMSFRVRLLRINYNDTRGKIKRYTQYGFLIEDVDDVTKRNNCREVEKQVFQNRNYRPATNDSCYRFPIYDRQYRLGSAELP